MTAAQLPGHAPGWKWRKEHAGQVERPWAWSQINGGEDVPAHVGGLCESGWHSDCPQAPLQQPAGAGQCSCRCHYTREDRPMTYLPTPEQFLAEPSTEEDDLDEAVVLDPLESIAESLRALSNAVVDIAVEGVFGPVGAETSAAEADERYQRLDQEYADLEDKHRSLYELLSDVEKIVAKSSSKVSLDVKAAINAWRNPVVPVGEESEPDRVQVGDKPEGPVEPAVQCPACTRYFVDQELLARHECTAAWARDPLQPAADALLEVWRASALERGVEGAESMNRSQIRTALGLPHFEG